MIVAGIRRVVDGVPLDAGGPSLGPDETVTNALRWADDVAEAYGATYGESGIRIGVYAVRFKDPRLAMAAPHQSATARESGPSARVVMGSTVVRVLARAPVPCFSEISNYISSLR